MVGDESQCPYGGLESLEPRHDALVEALGGLFAEAGTVQFSDTVDVHTSGGTPTIAALVGEMPVSVPFREGSGTETLTFSVALGTGTPASQTVLVAANALALNGGAISNRAGENADIEHVAFGFAARAGQSEEPGSAPLTASLDEAPASHDGESRFHVRIAFSEGLRNSYRTFARGFEVANGAVTGVKRVDRRDDLWRVPASCGPGSGAACG